MFRVKNMTSVKIAPSLTIDAVIVETSGINFQMEGKDGYSGKWIMGRNRSPKIIIVRKAVANTPGVFDIIVAEITKISDIDSPKGNRKRVYFTNANFQGQTSSTWEAFTGSRSYGSKIKYVTLPADEKSTFSPTAGLPDREIEDIEEILNDMSLSKTQKMTLIEARRGQGIFREKCLEIYPACPVTGLSFRPLLIASHIKPWRDCDTGTERLNPHNGVMLAAHVDVLFDSGYLSFTNEGEIILSPQFDSQIWEDLNIKRQPPHAFNPKAHAFLEWHRENVLQK
jgi:hypothetical protein